MSNINKQALRERYSEKPAPKCHICGSVMTIQRMSYSRITYGCSGATYDDNGCHYAEGRSIADDHYAQSRVTVVDVSDPEVLALLDELEAMDVVRSAQDYHFDQQADRIKSLEKRIAEQREYYDGVIADGGRRIAELEARTVKFPQTIWYDCDGESQEIAVLEKRLVEKALCEAGVKFAAGIGKGE